MRISFKRWKRAAAVLLGMMVVLMGSTTLAQAQTETTTLRVAFYPLEGFFAYDEDGQESGYGVEVLQMISKYTGIQFTYVEADSWEATKYMLLNDEADIRMPGTLPKTPSDTLGYTEHSIIDTYYAVMTLKDRTDLFYQDYDEFAKLKFGMSQSLYNSAPFAAKLAGTNITQDNLVFYEGYNECREALANGEVDAVISNIMDLDNEMKQLDRFSTVSNYISMRIDDPQLEVVNDALSKIETNDPTALSNLYKKWFPDRIAVPFTRDETDYMEREHSLTFSFRDGQGYLSRREENGDFIGLYPAIASMICSKLGVECMQTDQIGMDTENTVVYPDFYYDYNWAKEAGVSITQPYASVNYYEMKQKNKRINKENCKVAAVKTYRVTQDIMNGEQYDDSQMVWCDTYGDCMEAVYRGNADVTYINSNAAEYYLSIYRYSNLSSTLTDYTNMVCMGVSGADADIVISILNKTLGGIPTDEFNALLIETSAQKPQQDLLVEWIYQNPLRSILLASGVVAVIIIFTALLIFMQNMKHKNTALAKATNTRQEFLSRMSHDMRTPMNAIIGFSGFGRESKTLDEATDYHNKIYQSGQYLLQLINDTLDLNKIESGKYNLNPVPYSSAEFIEQIRNVLEERAREKGVTLEINSDMEKPLLIMFDKIRLQQIFVNLLNNAVKFTPRGGHVKLGITHRMENDKKVGITFVVEDDGIGMSEEFRTERLFTPFEQEGVLNDEAGTGLGLSIVYQLVVAMGGNISCESKKGEGTRFTVNLSSEISDEQVVQQTKTTTTTTKGNLEGKRVLLCEDHPLNVEIVMKILERVGVTVESAMNGQEGVDLFEQSKEGYYHAILMDVRMPVMDGLEATRQIRELRREDARRIPIIALSANTFEEDIQMSLDAGMNAHLAKPIDSETLYHTLEEYIDN